MMSYNGHFRVWRGDADGGEFQDFEVEVYDGEVVLDVIHRLQATQAPDLAVRWNCKAGKCGSCSAEVNGHPKLLCMARMSTFSPEEIVTVTPMRTFQVVRDLVPDVSFNYEKAREIPSFTPPVDVEAGQYRMKQEDVTRSHEFRKCIECFLCQDVCHVIRDREQNKEAIAVQRFLTLIDVEAGQYRMKQEDVTRSQDFRKCIECFLCQDDCHVIRDHEENKEAFAGPRFLMRLAELEMHPMDEYTKVTGFDRRDQAQTEHGLGMCNITKCCTEVCPENIQITDNSLIPMKERVADKRYDPIVWLGNKLFKRSTP